MDMFQQLMLKFATMEHDVQNLKDAVEEVKNMVIYYLLYLLFSLTSFTKF